MATQEVLTLYYRFKERWNTSLASHAVLELDFTWPSVAVIDLITSKLRLQTTLDDDGKLMLKECAAYLGVMAEASWRMFGGQIIVEDGPEGICISRIMEEDKELEVQFPIEAELGRLLMTPPSPLGNQNPVSRLLLLEQNLVSSFSMSLFSGLGLNPNNGHNSSRVGDHLSRLITTWSESAASWYGRVFPHESIGQTSSLYLRNLIFPPLVLSDESPGLRAVQGLLGYAKDWSLSGNEILTVCKNLCMCPDDLISSAALTVYCAVMDQPPPVSVLAAAHGKGKCMGLLRPTMLHARAELDLPGDWILASEHGKAEAYRFQLESSLGFLPWVYLDSRRVANLPQDRTLREVLLALSQFDLPYACSVLDRAIRLNPSDYDLRLQRTFLDITLGDYVAADLRLDALSIQQGVDLSPRFHDLRGSCCLARNDQFTALQHYRRAVTLCRRNPLLRSNVANNYAWALMRCGDYSKALWILNIAQRDSASPVWSLVNKSLLYWGMGFSEQQKNLEQKLLAVGPLDRRVVSLHWEHHLSIPNIPMLQPTNEEQAEMPSAQLVGAHV